MAESNEDRKAVEDSPLVLWRKFVAILTPKHRRDCVVLAMMMTVGMVLEMAGFLVLQLLLTHLC